MKDYVLITAARNEAAYIDTTLRSVIAQTVPPSRWVIVSDGSTDGTEAIVKGYSARYPFITLISLPATDKRNFGAKARAVGIGYAQLEHAAFEYVGNLDADVGFEPDYYQRVLGHFEADPTLGICGGIRHDWYNNSFHRVHCASTSVGGPFQLFRRRCFEQIGGYRPLPHGGIDTVAETTARMYGWTVRSCPELIIRHYRCTGTATAGLLRAKLRAGHRDYLLGYHPLFEFLRTTASCRQTPLVIGGLLQMLGYAWAALRRSPRPVSAEFVNYLRSEQMDRLREAVFRRGVATANMVTPRAIDIDTRIM